MAPALINHLNAVAAAEPDDDDSEDSLLAELRDVQSQTGWGLSLVRGIAATCDGRIAAGAAPEGGAMVWLSVPGADAPRREVPAPACPRTRCCWPAGSPTPTRTAPGSG